MGVADNRTYKNEYHFTDDTRPTSEQHPSIEKDPKVNTTIKKNPYRSNVEIEGGEVVLQPDLSALFKAKGKRHAQGGMDVLLKPDSFVFSDYKELEIDEDEAEDFELKEGGTPAKTLKKNVDIKHYNTLIQNIDNPYKDDLAKKSSARMLEKYIKMLGNIAYLQENKKGFPQGLPDFSIGTAPIENEELENQIDENKQYMKAGGTIKNPYAKVGLTVDFDCPCGRKPDGTCLPCPDAKSWDPYINSAKQVEKAPEGSTNVFSNQSVSLYQIPTKNAYDPGKMGTFGKPTGNLTPQDVLANPQKYKTFHSWMKGAPKDVLEKAAIDYVRGNRNMRYNYTDEFFKVPVIPQQTALPSPSTGTNPAAPPPPSVENQEYTPQGLKRADWQFTPWQKLSQAYNWGQYAGVQRYMPFRSRYNATYVDPALVNPEQAIGDMKGMTNQQLASLSTLSPILRNAQAAGSFGQLLGQIGSVRSQYDNQNAQILNQARMYNNQVKNNESLVNMGNDQQYYTQAIEGRKNFDNMRTFTANQAMNNVLRDVETNQKLAYNLLTQNNPAYNFDWKTGRFTRTNKSILDVATDSKSDWYTQVAGKLMEKFNSGKELTNPEVNFLKAIVAKDFKPSSGSFNPFEMKKGGKKRNPYK